MPPREATRRCRKFAALFGVHNLPGGVPENVEFLVMRRAWRCGARPVFPIVHDSLTRLSAYTVRSRRCMIWINQGPTPWMKRPPVPAPGLRVQFPVSLQPDRGRKPGPLWESEKLPPVLACRRAFRAGQEKAARSERAAS